MPNIVQVKNPKTQRYRKINRSTGTLGTTKKTAGPYKGVPIARMRKIRRSST